MFFEVEINLFLTTESDLKLSISITVTRKLVD